MKKTVMTISALLMTLAMSAQSMGDGLMFSRNNYVGTARSMAMGNAVTALGGDLGGVTINPAGSAVASYSQITLTPGLNFSISTTQGVPPEENGSIPYFQRRMRNTNTAFNLPNVGFSINWDTYATRGLKNFTFGVVFNQTQSFSERTYANGTNNMTSFMGSLAENAWLDKFSDGDLGNPDSWNSAPWDYVAAMQGGLIAPYTAPADPDKVIGFIGATEAPMKGKLYNKVIPESGLEQYFGRERYGSKNEYAFNFGMNFNDKVYVGLNLNINSLDYNSMEYMKEETIKPEDFETEFTLNSDKPEAEQQKRVEYLYGGKLTSTYRAYGVGFSTKLGIIYTPVKGLRLGAAIQTPTWNKINEEWTTDARTEFSQTTFTAESPLGKNSYKFREPMRANFGIAYVLGSRAIFSADYELAAYNQMRFNSYDAFSDEFNFTNEDIRTFAGVGHNLRIGAEVKIIPEFSIRAGYGLLTSGEYSLNENGRKDKEIKAFTHNASFGLGYSSKGSFFADIACVGTFHPAEYIIPYREYVYLRDASTGDYITDADDYLIPDPKFMVPEIKNIRNNWKLVLTLGFRF